jgi:hypothetical protein
MIVVAISASSTTIEQRYSRLATRTCSDLSEPVIQAVFAVSLQLSEHHAPGIRPRPNLDGAAHRLGRPMAYTWLSPRDSRA